MGSLSARLNSVLLQCSVLFTRRASVLIGLALLIASLSTAVSRFLSFDFGQSVGGPVGDTITIVAWIVCSVLGVLLIRANLRTQGTSNND